MEMNGIKVDPNPREVTKSVLTLFPDMKYWSKDALEKLYVAGLEIGIEAAEEQKGGGRFINDAHRRILFFVRATYQMDRPWVLRKVYNEILRLDGLSTLPGFGFANRFGDRIAGNSETQSMLTEVSRYARLDTRKERLLMSDLKRSELKAIAEELNQVLGVEPPIDTKQSAKDLQVTIIKAAELIDPEGDTFTDETAAGLEALGCLGKAGTAEGPAAADPPEEPEEGQVPTEPEEAAGSTDLAELVINTKKLADLKDIVNKYDEFKKLRKGLDAYQGLSGPRELKPVMFKALGVDTSPTKIAGGKKKDGKRNATTEFGHRLNSQAGNIDVMLLAKETSIEAIAKGINSTEARVQSHIQHLRKDKGIDIVTKDGKVILKAG
jgi:hypothetical protein